tara:strand:- start:11832 stop:11936 length:105 start_codon:yes stop_codon:yes gene_type:complete
MKNDFNTVDTIEEETPATEIKVEQPKPAPLALGQ